MNFSVAAFYCRGEHGIFVMNSNKLSASNAALLKELAVLYVEDDRAGREQLGQFLERRVGALYTAGNGKDGFEAFERYRPDVVITDIRMPVMDGLQMAEAIKQIDDSVPIIIITAFNDQNFFLRSIDIGIDKYVLKPVDTDALLSSLFKSADSLLQKREREADNRYVQFILDTHPGFLITTTGDEVEYINKTFLDFLGYECIRDFKERHSCIEKFISEIDGIPYPAEDGRKWIPLIIDEPEADHIVCLRSGYHNPRETMAYLVTCNKFQELDKYILSFTDITRMEKERKRLIEQSITDPLTGIYNRVRFNHSGSSGLRVPL